MAFMKHKMKTAFCIIWRMGSSLQVSGIDWNKWPVFFPKTPWTKFWYPCHTACLCKAHFPGLRCLFCMWNHLSAALSVFIMQSPIAWNQCSISNQIFKWEARWNNGKSFIIQASLWVGFTSPLRADTKVTLSSFHFSAKYPSSHVGDKNITHQWTKTWSSLKRCWSKRRDP